MESLPLLSSLINQVESREGNRQKRDRISEEDTAGTDTLGDPYVVWECCPTDCAMFPVFRRKSAVGNCVQDSLFGENRSNSEHPARSTCQETGGKI